MYLVVVCRLWNEENLHKVQENVNCAVVSGISLFSFQEYQSFTVLTELFPYSVSDLLEEYTLLKGENVLICT